MSELICIIGRISTSIGDKQQSKVADLGVVSFGRFVPDSGSGSITMLTAMVNLP